jgi:hypothetical protein
MKGRPGKAVNLLDLVPVRRIPFDRDARGQVVLAIPRYGRNRLGKWLERRLGKGPIRVRLDEVGSAVWELCDGRRDVAEIGRAVEERFGERIEPVYDRLALFLKQLERWGSIGWAHREGGSAS